MTAHSRRLAHLEAVADATMPEVDTSWTRHPSVVPVLAELGAIPLPSPPPCDNPLRAGPNAISAALGDPIHGAEVRKLFCRLAETMCAPGADKSWIPTFAKQWR